MTTSTSASPPARDDSADRLAYLRHPTLQGDRIAFVADDDLWTVAAEGGIARRLTAGLSEPSTPCLSPDGRWLAFVGRDELHPEVHVMPAEGGQARRLTWLGTDTQVRGWTPANEIAFVTTQGQPFFRNHQGFAVAPTGGPARALALGQVNHIAFGAGGRTAIGRNTDDPARWKRYRGGRAGAIWVDGEGSGTYRRLDQLAGNVTTPMWIGDRLYFLGDGEGVGNLYSCRADGSDVRRHTDHDSYYARQAQSDGRRIVYACGARLWLFDPAQDATRELAIETPAHRTQAARRFVPSADHLEWFKPHPAGHSLALVARGQLFSMPLWEGAPTRRADDSADDSADGAADAASSGTERPAARLRRGQWLADGTTMIAASDASGEERLVVFGADGARTLPWDTGHVSALVAAPVGTQVAFANHRNEVWIGDVESGALVAVDTSTHGRSDDLAWSPDGAWLAYTFATDTRHVALRLFSVAARTVTPLTEPEFRDSMPAFDPDGRYLYFVSVRTFDPVYDSVHFDLSFPRGGRPYLIALQAGGRPPFDPEPRSVAADAKGKPPGASDDAKGKARESSKAAPVRVDLDGIARRVAAFPVAEGRYGRIAGVAGRKVVWNLQNIVGAHGRGGHKEAAGKLERFDFATGRTDTLADKSDDFALADDAVSLVYRDGKTLRAIGADRPAEAKPDPAEAEGPPSRRNGRIDLDRIRVAVEPRREWRQMLREVWRLQRDNFWSADLSGVDWDAVWRLYAPLLDRVATRADFSDLVWEMQGELGTSHAYESGGDHRKPPALALGHLAAATRWNEARGGHEITEIARGDPWDASADSPLNAIGVEAKVGERIVAVDGQPLAADLPPEALLVHRAGQKVQLTIASDDAPGKKNNSKERRRDAVVTALADDVPVYYRQWVETNRAWVHERSGGRVGYFHLPDMQAAGFAEFHRYFGNECERDALIVDVRYNRGGHVSQLLLEKVARRRIAFVHSRWMNVSTYPEEAVAGPVVTLTNEHAGSDGDIFSHNIKLMKVGPLVGKRTWGGVVGIWPRHRLVDGSETTQPEFAFWFTDVGFGVENHGTDPDIEVDNAPQDTAAGRDRQLEVALQTALESADRAAPLHAPQAARPVRARKPLPPRR